MNISIIPFITVQTIMFRLQKIEELTLYVIEQQKEIEALKTQINK